MTFLLMVRLDNNQGQTKQYDNEDEKTSNHTRQLRNNEFYGVRHNTLAFLCILINDLVLGEEDREYAYLNMSRLQSMSSHEQTVQAIFCFSISLLDLPCSYGKRRKVLRRCHDLLRCLHGTGIFFLT